MGGVGGRMREGWRVWVDCHTQCFFSWQLDGVCVEVAKEGVVHWVGELCDADFTAGGWEGDITHTQTHRHTDTLLVCLCPMALLEHGAKMLTPNGRTHMRKLKGISPAQGGRG